MEKDTMVLCRKIKLSPVGEKEERAAVYEYLRNGMKAQNKAMNQHMTAMYVANVLEATPEDKKQLKQLYSRISTSKLGSAYDSDNIEFAKGLPSASNVSQKIQQDFTNACKKGLMYGKLSLPSYREDNPLLIHRDYVRLRRTNPHIDNGLYHTYSTEEEFLDALYNETKPNIFIKFAHNITFQLYLGQPYRSMGLRSELQKIFDERYEVGGSSIGLVKKGKGNDIILNLSISIPKQKLELSNDTVVGVVLGGACPVVCSTNTAARTLYLGSAYDSVRMKTQIKAQRRRLQKAMVATGGGHGRKKKMKGVDRLAQRERNFVKTYNHYLSRKVVDYAIEQKAKYINLEDTSKFSQETKPDYVLQHWAIYELYQFIKYKADKFGIIVRTIDSNGAFNTCCKCGHIETEFPTVESEFICPDCGKTFEADMNASKNISRSTAFTDEKVSKKKVAKAKKTETQENEK